MDQLQVVVAIVSSLGVGTAIGAVLVYRRGTRADLMTSLSARLTEVEAALQGHEARHTALWSYTRKLIDYCYRHRREDSPPLPELPPELS